MDSTIAAAAMDSRPLPSPPTVNHVSSMESDVIKQIREATVSPTPLSEFLGNPEVVRILNKPRKSRRASTNSLRDRSNKHEHRRKEATDDTSSILTLVLAEEEKSTQRLKTILRTTTDRLEHELRRADQADARAQAAEKRAVATLTRISVSEVARSQAELEATRAKDEVRRVQMLLEVAQRDLQRSQDSNKRLEQQKHEAEKAAEKAQDASRKYQIALRDTENTSVDKDLSRQVAQSRGFNDGRKAGFEEGHEEGYLEGKEDGYEEGHVAGFQQGRFEGFEEGRAVGREEGFEDGREEGSKEEREKALTAFQHFKDEVDGRGSSKYDRTQQWVQGTSVASDDQEQPRHRPIWLHRRLNTDPLTALPGRA